MERKVLVTLAALSMIVSLAGCKSSQSSDHGVMKAQADANGNYVYNGSFEDEELDGWTINNVDNATEEINLYTRETDCSDGVQCLHYFSEATDINFTVEQTLSGLEEGTYKLTGDIQGDPVGDTDPEIYFYVIADGQTYKADTTVNGYMSWNTAEKDEIQISGGDIMVGVSVKNTAGGWGTIDNISLVKE